MTVADTIGTRFGDNGKFWTKEEDEYLQRRYAEGATLAMIGKELGRSKNSAVGRKRTLEVRDGKPMEVAPTIWTDSEIDSLKRMYANWYTYPQIAHAIGKSATATKRKAADLLRTKKMVKRVREADHAERQARINSIEHRAKARAKAEESFGSSTFFDRTQAPHMAGLPIERLEPFMCRYPVNDAARGEGHLFCAARKAKGSYCAHHHAISWMKWRPS